MYYKSNIFDLLNSYFKCINLRAKRTKVVIDDGTWTCSVCTFNNRAELFKCEMCYVRKGTSTRKPKLQQVTEQFAKIESQIEQERKKDKRRQFLNQCRKLMYVALLRERVTINLIIYSRV